MQTYILRRLALAVPVAWLVTLLTFVLIRFLPGDVVTELVDRQQNSEAAQKLRASLGLDQPLWAQYVKWLGGVVQGDFGISLRDGRPVINEIVRAMPVTIELALFAALISVAVAIPFGIIAAIRQDTFPDYLVRFLSIVWLAIPNFWLGTLILVIGARVFRWGPPLRYASFFDNPWVNLQQFFFPALCLAAFSAAAMMRLTRSSLLEVLRQDYIRTATAKGLRERVVVVRHALKNALVPVVTVMGIQLAFLLGGAVVIESVFSLPGLGLLTLTSIKQRDYTQVQANVLVVAMIVVFVNLAIDIIYGWLDPRIRYSK